MPYAGSGIDAVEVEALHVPWEVLEVGPSGRSLVVSYLSSNHAGRARVILSETSLAIGIRVEQSAAPQADPTRRVARTLKRHTPIVDVQLAALIGGRPIGGEGLAAGSFRSFGYLWQPGPGTLRLPAVPNVIGLAPRDALIVLSAQGFDAMVAGDGPEIVEQRPPRGQVARNNSADAYRQGPAWC